MRLLGLMCMLMSAMGHVADSAEGLVCEACGENVYCINGTKHDCPVNSNSSLLSTRLEDCVCLPGFEKIAGSPHQCVLGTKPFYYHNGNKYYCPLHQETTLDQAGAIEDCECVPGFFVDGDDCSECAPNYYQDLYGQPECQACPTDSLTSGTASTTVTDCECKAGYVYATTDVTQVSCEACAAGKMQVSELVLDSASGLMLAKSNGRDNRRCINCMYDTYAAAASTECTDCPQYTQTLAIKSVSVDACLCKPGYEPDAEGGCQPCSLGHSKSTIENSACELCAADTFTQTTGATTCVSCQANTVGTENREICECSPGFFTNSAYDATTDPQY